MNKRKENVRVRKTPDELFPKEWIQVVRQGLKNIEESELDKPQRAFSNICKLAVAWKILGFIALEYTDPKLGSKIIVDAETVCNKVGTSLIEEGATVGRCLTKKHQECTGSYVNVKVGRTIRCECSCHG